MAASDKSDKPEFKIPPSDLTALVEKFKAFNLDNSSKDDANEMKSTSCTKMVNASLKTKYGPNISQRTDTVFSKILRESGSKKKTMTVNEANVTAFTKGTALAGYYLKTGKAPPPPSMGEDIPSKEDVDIVIKAILNCKAVKVATKQSASGNVGGLTDTSKYTGAHKERFDESGKGKGAEGREDRADNSGYVGNYKGDGSYGKKK